MIGIFIPLLFSLSILPSDSPKDRNTGKLYDKAVLYGDFIEHFIGLDRLVQGDEDSLLRISHCSIIEEQKTKPLKTYDGIGSCLTEQMLFLSEEENEKTSIRIHVIFKGKPFILFVKWDVLGLKHFFNSYWEKTPKYLDTSINFYSTENIRLITPMLETIGKNLDSGIHGIKIDFQTKDGVMNIQIKVLNNSQDILYQYYITTNYYINAESFFFASQIQDENKHKNENERGPLQ